MKSFDCKACKVSADRSIFLTNLFKKWSRSGEEHTARATILSRRMTMASFPTLDATWNFLVSFSLSDGEQVELHTPEEVYKQLKEGWEGELRWEGENMLSFETEE